MDIRDLEEFLAVLDHGSILRAAEEIGLAQPALSRRMRALEKSLGVPLLARSTRGVTPTVYGDLLARRARLVLRHRQQTIDELRSLRDGVTGRARVGIAPALASLLPRAIERLSEQRSGLTFTVVEGTYDSLVRGLRVGDIDGAFSLLVPGELHEGLAVRPLIEDKVMILCNPTHRLRRRRKLQLDDLREERWALMNRPRSIIDMYRTIAASRGLESPHISVETDSLDLIKSLVLRSSFLTALPGGAMRSELEAGQVAALAIADLPAVTAGFLHRQEVLPPAVELLLGEVDSLLRLA
jgi:DNA-binding transcriptional LysR family regulator